MSRTATKIMRIVSLAIVAWASMLITDNAPATIFGCCAYLILSQDL
jgi:hypothetical protein